ncbi:MAG: DUF4406 domain-containing protein [Peptococcaceae bacterium]|nr:DUF4406 domain-containing protein [Peptococcaceae bacterium]
MEWRNSLGYPDPTAAKALARVMAEEKAKAKRYRPLIYICSPFAGDIDYNTSRARGYCRFAVSEGCIPLAPHLYFPQFLDEDDKESRELGLFFALVLLTKCEAVWVFGGRITAGMGQEISKAERQGIPIRYFTDRCEEVVRDENSSR